MNKTFLIIGTLVVVVIAFIFLGNHATFFSTPTPELIACTEEAKLCPDGSYVARISPRCEFATCPPVVHPPVPSPSPSSTPNGITGTVLLGPTCPVMRNPPNAACADKPYQTNLVLTTIDGAAVLARFSSDTKGVFKINIAPGDYRIQSAKPATAYPRCDSTEKITVRKNAFTDTVVSCDTGIR